MNRFQSLFKNKDKKIFIPYFTLGDPTPDQSFELICEIIEAGAEALELGIPFSDPVADGPTNQRAMQRALNAGMTFDKALECITQIRQKYPLLPIGLLIYYNLIFKRGIARTYTELAKAGVDALICAELPLEESIEHEKLLLEHNLGCVHMVFPNTPLERAKQSLLRSSAFTYVVARAGTTGAQESLQLDLEKRLHNLKHLHDSALVVGFGLSRPEHVKNVWDAGANGAIVASCFANWIEQDQNQLEIPIKKIKTFMQQLEIPTKIK